MRAALLGAAVVSMALMQPWATVPARAGGSGALLPVVPGTNGDVAFDSTRSGNQDVWIAGADGSNPTQLTSNSAGDLDPTWSPDGTQIAFTSYRTGNGDLYVIDADGTNVTQLTSGGAFDGEPAWSPDGTQIAFSSTRSGNLDIWLLTIATGATTQLTTDTREQAEARAGGTAGNKGYDAAMTAVEMARLRYAVASSGRS